MNKSVHKIALRAGGHNLVAPMCDSFLFEKDLLIHLPFESNIDISGLWHEQNLEMDKEIRVFSMKHGKWILVYFWYDQEREKLAGHKFLMSDALGFHTNPIERIKELLRES